MARTLTSLLWIVLTTELDGYTGGAREVALPLARPLSKQRDWRNPMRSGVPQCAKANVSIGSIASFWPSADHFRSSPGNGHRQADPARPKSAPFPDSRIAAKQTLFDHFVRAGEHRCRQIEAERLGGFQTDHQLVLGRRLHRQISRLRSGPYQRSHGPCRSGPNVSVLFVQSSDEVAGQSSPGSRPQSNRTPNARAA
jgi:hypothetical protein